MTGASGYGVMARGAMSYGVAGARRQAPPAVVQVLARVAGEHRLGLVVDEPEPRDDDHGVRAASRNTRSLASALP
ncbi:hypothetical protein [Streptomyces canus]|uniref:hypothetical protein n=1 Tax=Streptomyces canus TaxID=58343 RepID=UPI002DDA6809|nr:hypothetical protein [Streptomyces canus]WSD90412.1 hypothetical protein OG925_41555 [Streptomyces canus]